MDAHLEELLRRLALNDDAIVEDALRMRIAPEEGGPLDAKTVALARLAALIALQSSAASYSWSVSAALAAGASEAEIAGTIVAVAPVVGIARVNRAAAEIATAVGYELDLPDWG